MTWILILWINPWLGSVGGTGSSGAAIHSITFGDQAACMNAVAGIHKADKNINMWCVPSAMPNPAVSK